MTSLFADTFRQTFHVRRIQSVDSRGSQVHGEAEPYPCRSEAYNRVVRGRDGEMAIAGTRIFTEVQVGADDLVFLPGADPEDVGQSLKLMKADDAVDLLSGLIDHYELYL
jgi:hypothetical protein